MICLVIDSIDTGFQVNLCQAKPREFAWSWMKGHCALTKNVYNTQCLCVCLSYSSIRDMVGPTLLKFGGWVYLDPRLCKFAFVGGLDSPKVGWGCVYMFFYPPIFILLFCFGDDRSYASEIWWLVGTTGRSCLWFLGALMVPWSDPQGQRSG